MPKWKTKRIFIRKQVRHERFQNRPINVNRTRRFEDKKNGGHLNYKNVESVNVSSKIIGYATYV